MSKRIEFESFRTFVAVRSGDNKGGFSLGETNDDFDTKFIWACAFLFVYNFAGEIFLFKIIKMNLTNSRQKKSSKLLDQSKYKLSTLSANKFPSDQIEDGR